MGAGTIRSHRAKVVIDITGDADERFRRDYAPAFLQYLSEGVNRAGGADVIVQKSLAKGSA